MFDKSDSRNASTEILLHKSEGIPAGCLLSPPQEGIPAAVY